MKLTKALNQGRAIKLCLDCHTPLVVGSNILATRFARAEYICTACKYIRGGKTFAKNGMTIEKQLAHGMKIFRVKLLNQIESLSGRRGRPSNLLAELKLFLKDLNNSIKRYDK